MRSAQKLAALAGVLLIVSMVSAAAVPAQAQENEEGKTPPLNLQYAGAALGAGLVTIGAALGIGRFAAAAVESIARQPQASAQITGYVNLNLFLLEGVAIIAVVVCLLVVLTT
jgi:F-type H+-transporting ATPase subunit c